MGAPVGVGDLLAEKYEVTRILGQGGMGVVVAARHRELDKLVALKFMHEEVAANVASIDRFLREARAAARLQNEHVGRVLDVGRLHTGVPYIVLEYLEGRDLSDVAADSGGSLPVPEVCEYMLQTCEAMAEAHAQGIIHRDLKPQNLFLTSRPDGRPLVKVLDFGISKVQSAGAGPTATSAVMGTPAYMSPEQMRSSKSCDGRADIWSLGVILYQLLSGTLPFAGDTMAETMLKVMTDEPAPLAQVCSGLPPALCAAVERCLRKNRDERFDNVAELAHELMPFAPERARAAMSLIERVMSAGVAQPARSLFDAELSSVVPSANTSAPKATVPPAHTTLGGSAMSLDLRPNQASPTKWIALSVVAVAAAVVITIVAVRGGGTTTVAASAPDASTPVDAHQAVPDVPAVATAPDAPVVEPPPDARPPEGKQPERKSDPKKLSPLYAFETRVCACKDKACATAVKAELSVWKQTATLAADQVSLANDIQRRISQCAEAVRDEPAIAKPETTKPETGSATPADEPTAGSGSNRPQLPKGPDRPNLPR